MTEARKGEVARRQPFGDLEPWKGGRPFRSLLEEFFGEAPPDWTRAGTGFPTVDITESDGDYKVRAELPGVAKNDVSVELEQGMLSIRGEKKSRRDEKNEKGRRLECSYGAFSRSFTLPQDADAERISAAFKDGVLEVTIAKRPESKPKQIVVKS